MIAQPIWTERETSVEFSSSSFSGKCVTEQFYPQRVSPKIFKHQESPKKVSLPSRPDIDAETDSSEDENMPCYSSESEVETKVTDTYKKSKIQCRLNLLC